ncbi:unnamed protein product [Urochloa decumbens]|uniref:Uncharacterized protein n=1 Tax=Urochloa decumbens TaxID=240449 RepID=A0ABC9BNL6_9POAL
MEATALSLGKSVLDGALSYAKSAISEEVALQLGVQRDHAFIRDELEMMQSFLMVAHDEQVAHKVLMTWVKQVRDVAYDAEDCLQEFSIHLKKPSWWRLPCTLQERRRIAKQMKELRARVENVSQRNLRYQLIKSAGPKLASAAELSSVTAAAMFGVDEARHAAKHDKSNEDLGTSGDVGQTSIINAAYENPDIKRKFPCRAWVRVLHPFNPNDFIQSLVKQFRSTVGIDILLEIEKTGKELSLEFTKYVNENSYLVVLNDMTTFEEWKGIKACFPDNKKGSRIIVCTPQVEVASLCTGQESQVLKLKQLSTNQTIYAFYEKDSWDRMKLPMPTYRSNVATPSTSNSVAPTNEIHGNQSKGSDEKNVVTKSLTRAKTIGNAFYESQLIGREKEKSDLIKLILNKLGQQFSVISVWGMGGIGKTILVKDVYQGQDLISMFEKRVFVTVMRPFILKDLLKSIVMQLAGADSSKKKEAIDFVGGTRNKVATLEAEKLIEELARLLEGKKCLIVFDDLSCTAEWDIIVQSFPKLDNTSRIIITTREESIAKHCSKKQENIYRLKVLDHSDALDLFTRKVFIKEEINLEKHPELIEEAKFILKKCNGLPLAIVTIGGFLANQPKTAIEWRKLNEHIGAELEMNPELEAIRIILGKSYDGLPYHLKSCFLYLSIFPEDHKVSRRRLMRRWTVEGYSREIREKSAEEIADGYFMELLGRSMILPYQESVHSRKGIDSCQVHDLMREISISKSKEENLVFRLEEGCSLNTHGAVRHLTINSNWEGDKGEFESTVDLSRIRSLTVFGKWRSFFISDKMSLLRVLDLENTEYLLDHHLEQIGKLLHLKYLSLRGCEGIFHLPESLGNLKQLQTLDIKNTRVMKLPNTIINLRKLQFLHAQHSGFHGHKSYEEFASGFYRDNPLPEVFRNKAYLLTAISVLFCVMCCAPRPQGYEALNRRDMNGVCCYMLNFVLRELNLHGVELPRGFRKLRALQTLSAVNVARGKGILKEIKRLTKLRKLAVGGVNKKNNQEFCATLADLCHLESLSVHSTGEPGLSGCLDEMSSPPKMLQSLKLHGNLVKLPKWVKLLHNLAKLKLEKTKLSGLDATIGVLGKLPNLSILRLLGNSFTGDDLHLTFHGDELFQSLTVLQLNGIDGLVSVEFKEGTMPMLEVLLFREGNTSTLLSGLSSLSSLRELLLEGTYRTLVLDHLRAELARNPNKPVLKRR